MSRDRGVEAWTTHTNEFERIRAIATALSEPRSAAWIADEACVEEATAQEYLTRLEYLDWNRLIQNSSRRSSSIGRSLYLR